jgi:hypothetical protein
MLDCCGYLLLFMKKLLQISFFSVLMIASWQQSYSQISNISGLNGSVLMKQNYNEVKGSPFLVDKWMQGDVQFANGTVLKNIAIMYDQVKDALLFKGKNDEDYYFNDPIREFTINYVNITHIKISKSTFRSGFAASKGLTTNSFFEILVDGKMKLLKRTNKTISETKEFNSATVVKNVNTNTVYYLTSGDAPIALKKLDTKSLIANLATEKATKAQDYISSNNLNLKNQDDLARVISYYNTL